MERFRVQKNHQKLIKKYDLLIKKIAKVRQCYIRRYRRYRSRRSRKRLLVEMRRTLLQIATQVLMPVWLGTPWHYYGTSESPHAKEIACGYFVVHILKALGFQFAEHFYHTLESGEKTHIYEFAKLSSRKMAYFMTSPSLLTELQNKKPSDVLKSIKKLGPGLYIIGLDQHVGLIAYDGKRAHFWHSQGRVKREEIKRAEDIRGSVVHVIGKVRPSRWNQLVLGGAIRVFVKRKWQTAKASK